MRNVSFHNDHVRSLTVYHKCFGITLFTNSMVTNIKTHCTFVIQVIAIILKLLNIREVSFKHPSPFPSAPRTIKFRCPYAELEIFERGGCSLSWHFCPSIGPERGVAVPKMAKNYLFWSNFPTKRGEGLQPRNPPLDPPMDAHKVRKRIEHGFY